MKDVIKTDKAPAAIGTYSQAVRHGNTLYISGQIPLDPGTMEIVSDDFATQASRVFENLSAVCRAAGVELDRALKFTVYLTDLGNFTLVNETMAKFLNEPFPARAAVEVSALPKGAKIEVDAIVALAD
ncbi:MAG: RidA family protein [Pseudomonadales bacterium]|nr:RidA family protein [Pseudomonadales bacterium]